MAARRARKTARRSTTRRRTTARKTTRRTVARRGSSRSSALTSSVGSTTAMSTKKPKSHDLAAMYMSILIVGIAGIILLVAKPTPSMQKIIGILLVVLGLWGLMMKK